MLMEDISRELARLVAESPANRVAELGDLPIFDTPLVGVAAADDPLFEKLKTPEAVGPHHFSPCDWLPEAQSVIVYFLPFSAAVRRSNRQAGDPSTEWLYGRIEGEEFNTMLRRQLVAFLVSRGYSALAPALDERFAVRQRLSNWSERHAAFVAGLGTFSLNRSLITERGSAGRVGSVITTATLAPTEREYTDTHEYCNRCGACILRCPVQAVNEEGKNNQVCSDFLDGVLARFKPRYGCGKCQTGVPCEDRAPGKRR